MCSVRLLGYAVVTLVGASSGWKRLQIDVQHSAGMNEYAAYYMTIGRFIVANKR